jgi:hypothetical protein
MHRRRRDRCPQVARWARIGSCRSCAEFGAVPRLRCRLVPSGLGQCASLAHLDLGQNGIGGERAGRLAAVLGRCASLAHLDVRANVIGGEEAGRLAAVLGQCASLSTSVQTGRTRTPGVE